MADRPQGNYQQRGRHQGAKPHYGSTPPSPAPGETGRIPIKGRHAGADHTASRLPQNDPFAPRPSSNECPRTTTSSQPSVRGRHRGVDRSTQSTGPAPGLTGVIPVIGRHAGLDRTDPDGIYQRSATEEADIEFSEQEAESTEGSSLEQRRQAVGASASLISICVIISRITGFARTWAMAFALGATFISSSYQVANNLPNMLYELVMGGMLVTAFLPVYLSVKKSLGEERGNAYASNLLTLVVLILGIASLLCMLFPSQVIFTQTFYSDQEEMALSVFFFQFFAIQVVFYGCSSVISGLLNAHRDYLMSSLAPVFNNLIVIASFLIYSAVATQDPLAAFYVIAIGNPLGVFVQMAIQIPSLRKNGIHLRPRIDFHDPALRDTLRLGAPALFVTICSFATVSAQNAASYVFADNGPSVIAYARLWFTFPYSFLAVPVTTAMFTELSDMEADGDTKGVIRGIIDGSSQIIFLMVPMALFLVVFSQPLVTLYHIGAFTEESIGQIARYLAVMALALPFYGVNAYLNKVFSSIRRMGIFSLINFVAVAAQVGVIVAAAFGYQHGYGFTLESVAASTVVSYVLGDIVAFIYLRAHYGSMGLRTMMLVILRSLGFGILGAAAGFAVTSALSALFGPLNGSILQALGYLLAGGLVGCVVAFGPAVALRSPEALFITSIVDRLRRRAS